MIGSRRGGGTFETAGADSRKRARDLQLNEIHVVRFVPGTSPLHRMWAGTKLVALGALSISLLLWPSWKSIGIVGPLVLIAFFVSASAKGHQPEASLVAGRHPGRRGGHRPCLWGQA